MKKYFLSIITCLLVAWTSVNAQTVTPDPSDAKKVTVTGLTPGTLGAALTGHTELTALTLSGIIDARDFSVIKSSFSSTLTNIDLSGITKIEDYEGTEGTASGSVVYPSNELPQRSFMSMRSLVKVVLPSNAGITSIGFGAFNQTTSLTDVNIPEGVTTIGQNAFAFPLGLTGVLERIILPASLTTIEIKAFQYSGALREVIFSGTSQLTEIKEYAFANTALTSIIIPPTVTRIENFAFQNVSNLTSITLPASLQWLGGNSTFSGTSINSLQIPVGTQIIDGKLEGFCSGCINLSSIVIPANVTEVGKGAFSGTALTNVIIPDAVITIGQDAFRYAPITSIRLSANLQTLSAAALRNLEQLEILELPASLNTLNCIGSQAFAGMTALKTLIANNSDPDIFDTQTNVFRDIVKEGEGACVLYVPAEGLTSTDPDKNYRTAYLWSEFKDIRAIGSNAVESTIENFEDITVEKGAAAITLSATLKEANDPREIKYSIETGKDAIATLQGNVLTIVGEGTAKITALAEGNNDFQEAKKEITLTVVDYAWLEEVAIAVEGNTAKVVGPAASVEKFTKFYVGTTETDGNSADISSATDGVELKATTANGDVVKIKYKK